MLISSFLFTVAVIGVPSGASGGHAGPWPASFAGDLRSAHDSVPTYRRGDTWELRMHGVDPDAAPGMKLRFSRRGADGWEPVGGFPLLGSEAFQKMPGDVLAARRRLVSAPGSILPVGLYRAEVRVVRGGAEVLVAAPVFAVVFNIDETRDGANCPWDREFLSPLLPVVTREDYGIAVFYWNLDIHHPWVSDLALRAAAEADSVETAIRRVARVAKRYVYGYWPNLVAVDGEIPRVFHPSSRDPRRGALSVTAWLAGRDQRGQCYDYAVLMISLLRSLGIPARAVTVVDPQPMPHPYDLSREVRWAFHVWVEVKSDGGWRAVDLTYQDALAREGIRDFGLRPEMGHLLVAAVGPSSRVLLPTARTVFDMTGAYCRHCDAH